MTKRTYQPKKKKHARKFGFLGRSRTRKGKRILKNRQAKKRKKLSS